MRPILLAAIFLMGLLVPAFAQFNREDPLGGSRNLIQQQELILFYGETSNANSNVHRASSRAYRVQNGNLVQTRSFESNADLTGAFDIPVSDLATGNLFGADYGDAVVYGYRSESNGNPIAALRVDLLRNFQGSGSDVQLTAPAVASRPNLSTVNENFKTPLVLVEAGDFYPSNPHQEIIMGYPSNGSIVLQSYFATLSAAGGGQYSISLTPKETFTGPTYQTPNRRIPAGIATARVDFDLDGRDELALAYEQNDELWVGVYGIDTLGSIVEVSRQKVLDPGLDYCSGQNASYTFSDLSIALASGDFNLAFPGEELVLVAHYGLQSGVGSAGNNRGLYVMPLLREFGQSDLTFVPWCDDNSSGSYIPGAIFTSDVTHFRDQPTGLDVAAGDLDGDLDAEIVVGIGPDVRCLDISKGQQGSQSYLQISQVASFNVPETSDPNNNNGGEGEYAHNWVAVGNIDPLTGNFGDNFRAEILVGKNENSFDGNNTNQRFTLSVWGFPGGPSGVDFNNPTLRAELTNIDPLNNNSNIRHFSVAMGDLDGGSIRLGTPSRTDRSEVLTPLVVLNAPPTHFDVFGSTAYDVCNLYGSDAPPANISHFNAVYQQVVDETSSFETQFNSDWAISGAVSTGFSLGGFSLGGKMEQTYGERFERVEGSRFTRTITNQRTALLDDELLAYFVDYSVFEYPVFRTGESQAGTHVMVVVPDEVREGFRGVRSGNNNYVPSHQHGNLFSYAQDLDELPLAPGSSINTNDFPFRQISKNSGFEDSFSITWSTATNAGVETQEFTETSVGANIGGAFKGFGLDVSVEGTYSQSEVQTRTNSYQQEVSLQGYFGQGERNTIPGDYPYDVTPIVYWDAAGTLVLDYLVNITQQGFWASFYDGYDPAFLLLEPHAPEKGKEDPANFNSAERYQTRDIRFDRRPTPGGQTTIRARVHNYGFQSTPAGTALRVDFYYLDPAGSDTLEWIGADSTVISVLGRVNGLDSEILEYTWDLPQNLGSETKVVAIIDEGDALPNEIHDYPMGNGISNNIGWTCLFSQACSAPASSDVFFPAGVANSVQTMPQRLPLRMGPNPTQGQAWLYFSEAWKGPLQVRVLNSLGQVIHQAELPKGAADLSHRLDCHNWAPGVYQVQVQSSGQQAVESLLVQSQ